MTEDEMVRQCHRSYQYEFNPTPGGSGRQEGRACSGAWGHEESDTTKQLNKTVGKWKLRSMFFYTILSTVAFVKDFFLSVLQKFPDRYEEFYISLYSLASSSILLIK